MRFSPPRKLRPASPISPYGPAPTFGSVVTFSGAGFMRNSDCSRAKTVGDVGIGDF